MFENLTLQSSSCLARLETLEEEVLAGPGNMPSSNDSRLSLVSIDTTSSTTSSARSTRDSIMELYERSSYYLKILEPRQGSFKDASEFPESSTDINSAVNGLEQLISQETNDSGVSNEDNIPADSMAPVDISYYVKHDIHSDETFAKEWGGAENLRQLLHTDSDPNMRRKYLCVLLKDQGDEDIANLASSSDNILPFLHLLRNTWTKSYDAGTDWQELSAEDDPNTPRIKLYAQPTRNLAAMRTEDYEFWKDALDEHNTEQASHLIVVHRSVKFAAICVRSSPAFSAEIWPRKPYEYVSCKEGQVWLHATLVLQGNTHESQVFNVYDTEIVVGGEFWQAKHVEIKEKPLADKSGLIRPCCFQRIPFLSLQRIP